MQGRDQGTSRQAGFFLEIETQATAEVEKPVHRLAEANSTTLGHTQVDVQQRHYPTQPDTLLKVQFETPCDTLNNVEIVAVVENPTEILA